MSPSAGRFAEHCELEPDAHPAGERHTVRVEARGEPVAERPTLKHNAAASDADRRPPPAR
jgi:hypothetical protein